MTMNASSIFTRHFSRLVWLLAHEPANIDAQKGALRSVVSASQRGAVTLAVRDGQLHANAHAVAESATDARALAACFAAHGVREVIAETGAAAADLLAAARLLASAAENVNETTRERSADMSRGTVRLTLAEPATSARSVAEGGRSGDENAGSPLGIVSDEAGGMFRHFAAPQSPRASIDELLARLDAARNAEQVTVALDDLEAVAENAALDGRPALIGDALWGIIARERAMPDGERRRPYAIALRRLLRPAMLRAVAALLPEHRERAEGYVAVLVRAGEDGADAVIEQLTQAQSIGDRRVFFDALRRLQAGVPTLIHMLGDARWFVVRNAADLLGEMRALEAEEPLSALLIHGDDRVRRSAARALLQLGTRTASKAVHEAMRSQSPEVRAQIAGAIAGRPDAQTVVTLTRALDDEADTEVQRALIDALGRVGTPEAVRRLASIAAPDGRLFRRKPGALRVAAVQALGEARTPEAVAALRELEKDRDREVREAVAGALARTTTRRSATGR